jgi:hypothetical protein
MGKYSGYPLKATPTGADKVVILDVADGSFPAGNEKLSTLASVAALGTQLDSTAADFQADGVAAAGALALAARADHVHPNVGWLSNYQAFSGATCESYPRILATTSTTGVSGTLYLVGLGMPKNLPVNNITFGCKGTIAAGLTHGWYVLADSGLVVRAVTADQTTGGFMGTANALFTLATTAAYTTTYTGLYYLGFMIAATTMPNVGTAGNVPGAWTSNAPILCGSSNTGATTPPALGATLTAIANNGNFTMYAYTS